MGRTSDKGLYLRHGGGTRLQCRPERYIANKQQFLNPPGRRLHPFPPHFPQIFGQHTLRAHSPGTGDGLAVADVLGVADGVDDIGALVDGVTDAVAVVEGVTDGDTEGDGVTGALVDGEDVTDGSTDVEDVAVALADGELDKDDEGVMEGVTDGLTEEEGDTEGVTDGVPEVDDVEGGERLAEGSAVVGSDVGGTGAPGTSGSGDSSNDGLSKGGKVGVDSAATGVQEGVDILEQHALPLTCELGPPGEQERTEQEW